MNKVFRLTVSAALLAWVAQKTEWGKLGAAFASLRVELWLAAVGLFCLAQAASAWRWQVLARALGFDRPLRQLTGFYFIGTYFNLLLPTSVGGDVVRAWYLDGGSGQRLAAFLTVMLDRLSGLLVLLTMACLAVLLSPVPLEPWIPWSVLGIAAGAGVVVAGLPLAARWLKLGEGRVEQVRSALRVLRAPRLFLKTTLLSAVVQGTNVVLVWLIGQALGAPVPGSFYWVLVPMVSLLTMLPISVNGMGVRELSTQVLLAPFGVNEGMALSLALLWFAVFATASLAGGVVYLFGRFPSPKMPAAIVAEVQAQEVQADHGSIDHHSDQGRARQPKKAA